MPKKQVTLRSLTGFDPAYGERSGKLYETRVAPHESSTDWKSVSFDAYFFYMDDQTIMGTMAAEHFQVNELDLDESWTCGVRDTRPQKTDQLDLEIARRDIVVSDLVDPWFIKIGWIHIAKGFTLEGPGVENLEAGLYASAPKKMFLVAIFPAMCFDYTMETETV